MTSPIAIVGVGARTPVGLHAASAAAAIRAGISALAHHPFMVDRAGDLMPGALDPELDARLIGQERLIKLAEWALCEASGPLVTALGSRPRLPVFLGLPEIRPGFTDGDVEEVRSGLARIEGLPVGLTKVSVFSLGHAAGVSALKAAVEQISQGAFDAGLVGGVESYFHPDTMEWLDANRQLVGTVARSGFVPGEGAGFCLLMSERTRSRLGLPPLARVRSAAVGKETKLIKTDNVCFGEGLTATVRSAVSGLHLPDERVSEIYCDINGERYRSEEWGFVCLRLGEYFDDPTGYLSPADRWGEMGAASVPLFAMLACRAFERGYAAGPRVMLWASSEAGLRGAAVLESSGHS
jgi:3-oxoacyl-[acyl-carrier-protein] synthase-1